jgi:DNA (cytosine-5)-methyltransferase 1
MEAVARPTIRWKLIGNAVTVNVCKWVAEGLSAPTGPGPVDFRPLDDNRWPMAAFGEKGRAWRVDGDYGPFDRAGLSAFLVHPTRPLSAKAINGFIGRARKGNLVYPSGFVEALESYSATL